MEANCEWYDRLAGTARLQRNGYIGIATKYTMLDIYSAVISRTLVLSGLSPKLFQQKKCFAFFKMLFVLAFSLVLFISQSFFNC